MVTLCTQLSDNKIVCLAAGSNQLMKLPELYNILMYCNHFDIVLVLGWYV